MRWLDASPRRAAPKGHETFILCAACTSSSSPPTCGDSFPRAWRNNTRDFRCLWRSGLLPLSSSVSVFESGCVVPPRECWHDFGPRVAAGLRAVPRSAAPGGRGGFSFLTVPASAAGYEKPGANTVTCGFPVTVCLVAVACRNFGRAF